MASPPAPEQSTVTTHVLDSSTGDPAAGVAVTLASHDGETLASGVTDADGRLRSLGPTDLPAGVYRLHFATGAYFEARGVETFYPAVVITFTLPPGRAHLHVPLLLSPFAYSTYRGS